MGITSLEELAPWIAIAFTLALSILVPLFTQIANNRFQLRMQKNRDEQNRRNSVFEEKRRIYSDFLNNVGANIAYSTKENTDVAGASIQKMYLVCPQEWWGDIDELYYYIRTYDRDKAEIKLKKLNKLIATEYSVDIYNNEVSKKRVKKKVRNNDNK